MQNTESAAGSHNATRIRSPTEDPTLLRLEEPRSGLGLVAGVLTGDQRLRIPFAVTNITLLGQPLAAR